MTKILGVIPARYDSSRLPGKAMIDIGGKTMVQRVYEQASKAKKLDQVIVATDDQRIYDHITTVGGAVMMTSNSHQTGTDRCAEVAAAHIDAQVIVNIQGDEPFIDPEQIDELAALFEDTHTEIATLAKKIISYDELLDEKEAKVVLNENFEAMYMSRSPIPYLRGVAKDQWHLEQDYFKHIGIYGFRSDILAQIPTLKQTKSELSEGLEQLRWLDYFTIKVGITDYETLAIDTAEDLKEIHKYL